MVHELSRVWDIRDPLVLEEARQQVQAPDQRERLGLGQVVRHYHSELMSYTAWPRVATAAIACKEGDTWRASEWGRCDDQGRTLTLRDAGPDGGPYTFSWGEIRNWRCP